MAVDGTARSDAPLEQGAAPGEVAGGQSVDLEHLVETHHPRPVLEQPGGVVRPSRRQRVRLAARAVAGAPLGRLVERGEQVGEVPEAVVDVGAAP